MKIKKAMKLYPIEESWGLFHCPETGKSIYANNLVGGWIGKKNHVYSKYATEKQAVAWLIEGAEKLSPIQVAMREHPDIERKIDSLFIRYSYGNKGIWYTEVGKRWLGNYLYNKTWFDSFKTEQEAVDWLLCDETNPFSSVSMLNKSGHTIPAGAWISTEIHFCHWHKCPTCGKCHNL